MTVAKLNSDELVIEKCTEWKMWWFRWNKCYWIFFKKSDANIDWSPATATTHEMTFLIFKYLGND